MCSSAYEVCGLVMKPLWSGLDAVCDLGNSLIASPARIRIASRVPYKDVVALAFSLFPLKPVPCTLESFKQALSADNTKGRDFVISNWYVIYVGGSHGNGAGAKRLTAAKKDWRPPSPSHSTASTSRSSGRERGASGASRWSTKETITITRSALKQKAQGIRQRRGGGHSLPVTSQGRACDKEHLDSEGGRQEGSVSGQGGDHDEQGCGKRERRYVNVGHVHQVLKRRRNVSFTLRKNVYLRNNSSPPYTSSHDRWKLIGTHL